MEVSQPDRIFTFNNARLCRERLNDVFKSDFQLEVEDFMKVCNPTTVMNKMIVGLQDQELQLIDIGGQLHFQGDWDSIINQTKSTHAVSLVYVVSLADYNESERLGNLLEQSVTTVPHILLSSAS
jgi:hypothetical protein